MGQQQLLLIILVTLIVALATFLALSAMNEGARNAVIDGVKTDLLELSVEAQGYYIRPVGMGGGGRTFNDISFDHLSISGVVTGASNEIVTNMNATYIINAISSTEFMVTAEFNDNTNRFLAIRVCQNQNSLGQVGINEAPEPPPCI